MRLIMINDIEFRHTGSIDQILMNEADGVIGDLEADVSEMDNEGIVEGIMDAFGGMGI